MQRVTLDSDLTSTRGQRPLLGYDYIVSVLENEGIIEASDETLKELSEFRRTNKNECIGRGEGFE